MRAAQVGAIVPFNYPFHNVFNPLLAAVFAGNAIVIKACTVALVRPFVMQADALRHTV